MINAHYCTSFPCISIHFIFFRVIHLPHDRYVDSLCKISTLTLLLQRAMPFWIRFWELIALRKDSSIGLSQDPGSSCKGLSGKIAKNAPQTCQVGQQVICVTTSLMSKRKFFGLVYRNIFFTVQAHLKFSFLTSQIC
jgi:hypothetical protein